MIIPDLAYLRRERCGLPTKSGKECKSILYGPINLACPTHLTEELQQQERVLRDLARDSYADGRKAGAESAKFEIENKVRAEWRDKTCKHFRAHDVHGRFLLTANGYTWHSTESVAVGDEVLLPASEWYASDWATVTRTESDYQGETRGILAIKPKDDKA